MGLSVQRFGKIAFGVIVGLAIAGCVSDSQSGRVSRSFAPPVAYAPPREVVQPIPTARPAVLAPAALTALVPSLTRDFGGKVGIAVMSIDDGWTVTSNGDLKLPQQSVSKLWVAMTVLDLRDQGKLTLDDPYTVRKDDLTLFHQPIAALVKDDGYKTTVRVEPNRNNDTAERFQSFIKANNIWIDLPTQRSIECGYLALQPVKKFSGGASTRDVDRYPSGGIKQAYERKIKTQRPRQDVSQSGGNRARFDPDPPRRDGRKCD